MCFYKVYFNGKLVTTTNTSECANFVAADLLRRENERQNRNNQFENVSIAIVRDEEG